MNYPYTYDSLRQSVMFFSSLCFWFLMFLIVLLWFRTSFTHFWVCFPAAQWILKYYLSFHHLQWCNLTNKHKFTVMLLETFVSSKKLQLQTSLPAGTQHHCCTNCQHLHTNNTPRAKSHLLSLLFFILVNVFAFLSSVVFVQLSVFYNYMTPSLWILLSSSGASSWVWL